MGAWNNRTRILLAITLVVVAFVSFVSGTLEACWNPADSGTGVSIGIQGGRRHAKDQGKSDGPVGNAEPPGKWCFLGSAQFLRKTHPQWWIWPPCLQGAGSFVFHKRRLSTGKSALRGGVALVVVAGRRFVDLLGVFPCRLCLGLAQLFHPAFALDRAFENSRHSGFPSCLPDLAESNGGFFF